MSVAEASRLMGVCKRQALRLLARRNVDAGGRLLRSLGVKRMPGRVQPSKLLVSVSVFRESMRPDDPRYRDVEAMRLELVTLRLQLAALRRAFARLQGTIQPRNAT